MTADGLAPLVLVHLQAQWWPNLGFVYIQDQHMNMMTSCSALLVLCEGNSPITGEFSSQRPVMWSLMFFLISTWTNGWVNDRDVSDLRCHHVHYEGKRRPFSVPTSTNKTELHDSGLIKTELLHFYDAKHLRMRLTLNSEQLVTTVFEG